MTLELFASHSLVYFLLMCISPALATIIVRDRMMKCKTNEYLEEYTIPI